MGFIKFGFTAGGFAGKSTSRMEAAFMDVDGDGNLDYILSDGEDDLRVATSNIRRTNRLKSVKNATGSTFEVDYEWVAPTYENPNSKWVLSRVTTLTDIKAMARTTPSAVSPIKTRTTTAESESFMVLPK